jgi:hypothetical protein
VILAGATQSGKAAPFAPFFGAQDKQAENRAGACGLC